MEELMKMETARSGELASQFIWESKGEQSLFFKIRERFDGIRKRRRSPSASTEENKALSAPACTVMRVEEAPTYLRRPFIFTGYLVGKQSCPTSCHISCASRCTQGIGV